MVKDNTDILKELQNLAVTDLNKFAKMLDMAGADLKQLRICKQREKGDTLQMIANLMQMPKSTVRNYCKVC